jgi:hypothetical protein
MRRRIQSLLMAFLVLSSASAVAAGQDDQLQRLQSALSMLDQEQQAIYQQFQMVQALRRSTPQPPYGAMPPVPSGEIANYDEAVAAQDRLIRRSNELAEQASQLVTRYGEIEEEKKPLQQEILRLMNGKK